MSPKAFGWGYTINFAHPAAKWVALATAIVVVVALVAR